MKIIKGNIWDYWEEGNNIIIPTNGTIKQDNRAVMGKGLALQATKKAYNIEYILGEKLIKTGNHVYHLRNRIFNFPTKYNWWEHASLVLIDNSAKELLEVSKDFKTNLLYVLPKVGCGSGGLNWKNVQPILDKYLSNMIVVDKK